VTVFPDDLFLVSYPRSGNTWLRFLLANALRPDETITFGAMARLVPDVYDEPDAVLRKSPPPRALKSHEPYDPRYPSVLYLVRNPVDVAASYYHYLIKMRVIDEGFDQSRFVEAFIQGSLDGFGTWGDHVTGWLDAREGDERFVLLRYEDLLDDASVAVREMLRLLGIGRDDDQIQAAVEHSSADELRRLERETATELPTFRGSRLDKPFIRTARVGAGAEELRPELVARIAEAWGPVAARLGYDVSPPP
jgi:sulfotransferase family protein